MEWVNQLYNKLKWSNVSLNPSLEDLDYREEVWQKIRPENQEKVLFMPRDEKYIRDEEYIAASEDSLEYLADNL
jgi:hypothetical protein